MGVVNTFHISVLLVGSWKDRMGVGQATHQYSPRMRLARRMSLGMIVMRLAWIAHRFVSSKRPTMYASVAS
jgi:hypothetical protein